MNSGGPNIAWLRNRLEHFRELASSRIELYSVTERERRLWAKRKASDSDNATRGDIQPVRGFSALETAGGHAVSGRSCGPPRVSACHYLLDGTDVPHAALVGYMKPVN
jgi:hypothetical protein